MKKVRYEITESERLIMDYLWDSSTSKNFAEIMGYLEKSEGKEWKKQTINTFLKRLINKGLVDSETNGKVKFYKPSIEKNEYMQGEAQAYLNHSYNGSLGNFISALSGGKKIDSEFAEQLRKIFEDE